MALRFLLDTHILIRWLVEPKKLSREQTRVLDQSATRAEPVGVSAITLLELVLLTNESDRIASGLGTLLDELENNPAFQVLPLTPDIAREMSAIGNALRDPADRTIVATARVHRLRLVTSDVQIINSGLISIVE